MRNKAFRIHKENCKKKKVTKFLKRWNVPVSSRMIGTYANSPARCSCLICGNPRKIYKNGKNSFRICELRKITKDE